MKINQLTYIRYTKQLDPSEITERVIVPTSIPDQHIKAFDVTDLEIHERVLLQKLYEDYTLYFNLNTSKIFNFETWLSHTQNISSLENLIKRRTFKLENIEERE